MSEEEKAISPKRTSTSWVKGQSGNPKGRAPRQVEREYLNIMMDECTPDRWRTIVQKAIYDAEKGDKFARDWLGAHLVGEPHKIHEHLIQENKSITIHIEWGQPGDIVEGESAPRMLQEGELIETEEEDE